MRHLVLLAVSLLVIAAGPAAAQDAGRGLRVFLDCQTGCDQTYVRSELAWVDWVRDRQSADVHALLTGQTTGGGGREYTLAFIGRADFEGLGDELVWAIPGDATTDERRGELVSHLGLGLARYAARRTDLRQTLDLAFTAGPAAGGAGAEALTPESDPWNAWVFSVGMNANLNGEESQTFSFFNGSMSANRTTEEWKFNVGGNFSESRSSFELQDTTIKSTRSDWSARGLAVKSLGAKFSAGLEATAGSSSFLNQDFRWSAETGLEYNLFPYTETTRRELVFQYVVGARHFQYAEETIYGEEDETRPFHALSANLELTQPWGRTNFRLSGAQYLHDTQFNSLDFFVSANIRLVRGLSLNVSGNYSRVRDQLYIPAGTLTEEEILLRQQALATGYRYFGSFGFSYRFGSIFNNVVNPRFGS